MARRRIPPSGLSDPALRAEIPADLVSGDPLEAISVANRLLSVGEEPKTAADYLGALGRNVQQLRKQRGWSQQELAAKAGLDRAYLSTVEKRQEKYHHRRGGENRGGTRYLAQRPDRRRRVPIETKQGAYQEAIPLL